MESRESNKEESYRVSSPSDKNIILRSKRPRKHVSVSTSNYTKKDSKETQRSSCSSCKCTGKRNEKRRSESSGMSEENELPHTSDTNTNPSKSSHFSNKRVMYCQDNTDIDETQPLALVMVFDTSSRIPRKIICCNINIERFESCFE